MCKHLISIAMTLLFAGCDDNRSGNRIHAGTGGGGGGGGTNSCGDGVCSPSETADLCPADCENSVTCGNGFLEIGEDCDDGNTANGDGCNSACHSELAQCGDGFCAPTETDLSCPSDCNGPSMCGNGFVEPGEICDDGNTLNGDGCSATCQRENVCGDNVCSMTEGHANCPSDCP